VWWKLGGLLVLSAALIFVIIPIRSEVVIYDPAKEPPPTPPSLWNMIGNMYLTPGTMMLIATILSIAAFAAFKVVRGHW
jgi:vacuolar-type H+-ATPase subunit I/STV1